jgi:hypothetical protein
MYIGLYVKYQLLLSDFDDTQIISTDFQTIKFNEKPSSGSRVVLRGRTDGQREREREREMDRQT